MRTTVAVVVAVAALLQGSGCTDDDGDGREPAPRGLHARYPDADKGDAFERAPEQGMAIPVDHSGFATLSLVALSNLTDEPVRVLGAQPAWLEDHVHVRAFGISAPGTSVTGGYQDEHVVTAEPLPSVAPIRPAAEVRYAYLLSFEATLEAPAEEGALLGIDVFYEQDGEVRWQRWPLVVVLCDRAARPRGCQTYRGRPTMELDFEPLLAEALADEPKLTP